MSDDLKFFQFVVAHVEDCKLCQHAGPCKTAEALFNAARDLAVAAIGIPDVPRSPFKA